MKIPSLISPVVLAVSLAVAMTSAHAAEGFQVRYNMAGSLGGEMFAPPDQSGLAAGVAYTRVDINKVTGNDGQKLRLQSPGGTLALPSPAPSSVYPSYGASSAELDATGVLELWNLGVGYVSQERFADGRLGFVLNLPYGKKRHDFRLSGSTPALTWPNASVPDDTTKALVSTQFGATYQAGLASQAAAESGDVSGVGDLELQAGWLYTADKLRVLAGASIVAPTGTYDSAAGPDIGSGNFYTLRPAVQVAYLPTPNWAIAAKLTLGFNTRNQDNELRSGNWAGFEGAIGYLTPLGPVGVHVIRVQQTQDDSNNPLGASKFMSNNAGVFFTTKISPIDAAVTIQAMTTMDSRNAKAGTFSQIRLFKLF